MENLKALLQKLDKNNLNSKGSVLFGYLWNASFNSETYKDDWKDIYKMPIMKDFFKDYISQHYDIAGPRDILFEDDSKSDLILVYRKK